MISIFLIFASFQINIQTVLYRETFGERGERDQALEEFNVFRFDMTLKNIYLKNKKKTF